MNENNELLFKTPFTKLYWKTATSELKSVKILVFAAIMIALRVVMKSFSIPIAADLNIGLAFFINALGAMVFGPVVAMICAAISDTIGAILFPTGVYFFPFILTEVTGSLIFALFFYKTTITQTKVILARFCVCFFVNIVLTTPIMSLYYEIILERSYVLFHIPRIAKNLILFPFEGLFLMYFLKITVPICTNFGFGNSKIHKLEITKKTIIATVILFGISIASIAWYSIYMYNTTSVSSTYTPNERLEMNNKMKDLVIDNTTLSEDKDIVAIIESGYREFLKDGITYTVSLYNIDLQKFYEKSLDDVTYTMEKIEGYSKTPAQKDDTLNHFVTVTIKTTSDGAFISLE